MQIIKKLESTNVTVFHSNKVLLSVMDLIVGKKMIVCLNLEYSLYDLAELGGSVDGLIVAPVTMKSV